jgi:hypothetical protein
VKFIEMRFSPTFFPPTSSIPPIKLITHRQNGFNAPRNEGSKGFDARNIGYDGLGHWRRQISGELVYKKQKSPPSGVDRDLGEGDL